MSGTSYFLIMIIEKRMSPILKITVQEFWLSFFRSVKYGMKCRKSVIAVFLRVQCNDKSDNVVNFRSKVQFNKSISVSKRRLSSILQ